MCAHAGASPSVDHFQIYLHRAFLENFQVLVPSLSHTSITTTTATTIASCTATIPFLSNSLAVIIVVVVVVVTLEVAAMVAVVGSGGVLGNLRSLLITCTMAMLWGWVCLSGMVGDGRLPSSRLAGRVRGVDTLHATDK